MEEFSFANARDSALPHRSHRSAPKNGLFESYDRRQWIELSPSIAHLEHFRTCPFFSGSVRLWYFEAAGASGFFRIVFLTFKTFFGAVVDLVVVSRAFALKSRLISPSTCAPSSIDISFTTAPDSFSSFAAGSGAAGSDFGLSNTQNHDDVVAFFAFALKARRAFGLRSVFPVSVPFPARSGDRDRLNGLNALIAE